VLGGGCDSGKHFFYFKDLILKLKNKQQKNKETGEGGGQGPPDLSARDESRNFGQTSVSWIRPRIQQGLSPKGNIFQNCIRAVSDCSKLHS